MKRKVEASVMSNRLERIGPGLVPEEKKKPDLRKVMESFHDECKAALAAKEKELRKLRRVFRAAVRWAKSRERFAALWSYDKALLTAVERATRRGR